MNLGLVAIVRDEQEVIGRCLESIRPHIGSWCVVDTGSTDNTRQRVKELLADIPGQLHHRGWRDFAANRTEALQLAQGTADYHLMLDADHVIEADGEQPELTADSYLLRVKGSGDEWRLPLLTRDGHPFEYRGAAHAALYSPVATVEKHLDWLTVHGGGGVTIAKLERDMRLLEQAFVDNPADTRTVFYLAQTYRDLGQIDSAIAFYRLRAGMGGWAEEVYWARYQLGVLLGENVDFSQAADALLQAWRDRPTRIEALRALARLADSVADKAAFPTEDSLFVRSSHYGRKAA